MFGHCCGCMIDSNDFISHAKHNTMNNYITKICNETTNIIENRKALENLAPKQFCFQEITLAATMKLSEYAVLMYHNPTEMANRSIVVEKHCFKVQVISVLRESYMYTT